MTSNKDIEPTHYGTDFSLSRISDNDLWIENSSQISEEKMCKTTVLNLLQNLDQYIWREWMSTSPYWIYNLKYTSGN